MLIDSVRLKERLKGLISDKDSIVDKAADVGIKASIMMVEVEEARTRIKAHKQ